jgi:hypothetical protein
MVETSGTLGVREPKEADAGDLLDAQLGTGMHRD